MYDFILQLLIMSSLATIIYLAARAIPRIDESALLSSSKNSAFRNWISNIPLEKIDLMFDNLLEKLLRKIKIVVMKTDNVLTRRLSSFKPDVSGDKNTRPNIFENSGSGNMNDRTESK